MRTHGGLPCVDGAAAGRRDVGHCRAEQAKVVAATEVPVSAVHGAVLQVVGEADAPLPQQETFAFAEFIRLKLLGYSAVTMVIWHF